jgi:uncharacterized protein DUF3443
MTSMTATDSPSRPCRRWRLGVTCLALLIALGGCGGGGSTGTSSPSYTVGGTVSGLTGKGLVLEDDSAAPLSVSGNGSFVFTSALASGDSYAVTVMTQPSDQTCIVDNSYGTVASADVVNVAVSCHTIAAAAPNVATLVVDSGPAGLPADSDVNMAFVTVTVCAPGSTTTCQSIDHVQVDTGSYGLRLLASALSAPLYSALTQVYESSSGQALAECTVFEDGTIWGPIKNAGVQIASESAASMEVQLFGDPAYSSVPTDCANTGTLEDALDTFGANGIIGIGPFAQDCGLGCTSGPQSAWYYVCPSASSCTDSTVSLTQQVQNPVTLFAPDNNGSIVELPAIPSAGAATVTGALVFGIGTEGNNDPGTAKVLTIDNNDADLTYGDITTKLQGQSLTQSFLDTGSTGLFFNDSSLPACAGGSGGYYYCPLSPANYSATNIGLNDASSIVSFSVVNASTLSGANYAFNNLGGSNQQSGSFDWGLPFFFGRNVYTAIDGQNTSAGSGPYFAY